MITELIMPIIAIVFIYGLVTLVVFMSYRDANREEKIGFFKWLRTKKENKENV